MTERMLRHRRQVCANKIHRLEIKIERFKRQLEMIKRKKEWLDGQVPHQLTLPNMEDVP